MKHRLGMLVRGPGRGFLVPQSHSLALDGKQGRQGNFGAGRAFLSGVLVVCALFSKFFLSKSGTPHTKQQQPELKSGTEVID